MPSSSSRRAVLTSLLASSMLLTASCAKLPGEPSPIDRYRPLLRLGVSLATERLLAVHPRFVPSVVQVSRILIDVADSGDFTSVDALEAFMLARIPWDAIDQEFLPLLKILIGAIAEELRVVMLQHQIPSNVNLILVRDVFTWVRDVAERNHALQRQAAILATVYA